MGLIRPSKSWLYGGLAVLFGLVLAVGALELLLRVAEAIVYRNSRGVFAQYKDVYSDERLSAEYVFGHKKNVSVKMEKGPYHFQFTTNAEGLREDKDYGELKKSVIFLGDSIVEGAAVESNETMESVFARAAGITTLNFGVGSTNTVHQYYFLKAKYKPSYHTRLIILGFCLNDVIDNDTLRYFDPQSCNWRVYRFVGSAKQSRLKKICREIARRSYTLVLLRKIGEKAFQRAPWSSQMPTRLQLELTREYLTKIKAFSDQIGADFLVVLFPMQNQLAYAYKPGERLQDDVIEILKSSGIDYVDLFDPIKKSVAQNPNVRWFHDTIHPYVFGHAFIGNYLAEFAAKKYRL
jgi:hypothetical protein